MERQAIESALRALCARAAREPVSSDDESFVAMLERYRSSEEQLLEYWRERWQGGDRAESGSSALSAVGDLLLAQACAQGCREAISDFTLRFRGLIVRATTRVGFEGGEISDAADHVLMTMLFPEEGRPAGIIGYSARGALSGWVASYTMRCGLRIRRDLGRRHNRRNRYLMQMVGEVEKDLELDLGRHELTSAIKEAFERAVDHLDERDRVLLHWSYVAAMNVDEIGALYEVHRATAARWVAAARSRLVGEMSRILLGADGEREQLLELMGDVRSRLDLSLSRVLRIDPS